MGSSNGVTRGQLRPYFSGRTPPFILVGTLIILIIFGFSYWSLNSQYGDLQVEVHEFQEQLRVAAQKRLELEKQSHSLQEQLLSAQETSSKCQDSLQKKEDELTDLTEQVRESSKIQSLLDTSKIDLERCQEEKTRHDDECSSQKDSFKQMEVENLELKKTKDQLQLRIYSLQNEMKKIREQKSSPSENLLPKQVHEDGESPKGKDGQKEQIRPNNNIGTSNETDNKSVEQAAAGNPDIGTPPVNYGGNINLHEDPNPSKNGAKVEVPPEAGGNSIVNDPKNPDGMKEKIGEDLQ